MNAARGFFLVGAIGLAVAGALWWHATRVAPVIWQGYAEADYVKVGPEGEGRLTRLSVERGQQVAAGAPLFDQDDTAEVAALAQARSAEDQARAQLRDLEQPAKPEEIAAARANLADATATLVRIRRDLDLAQRHGVSPADAVVADVLARPGETLAAGGTAISLLPPGNIFVRFFVAEKALAGIHLGARVRLACDSCDPNLYGVVSFISPAAEYTPPVIYSDESREKLVTMIEARPPKAQAININPGELVQVSPP